MRSAVHARVAFCLAGLLTALCLFARPIADCLTAKAPYCAAETMNAPDPVGPPPVSVIPVAFLGGTILGGIALIRERTDLRVRMPASPLIARVPWRDRFLPYAVAVRDP